MTVLAVKMSEDKRTSPRVLHAILAEVQVEGKTVCRVRTMDLSQGGALFDAPVAIPVGTSIDLAFKIGKHELNPISCEVRRVGTAFGGNRFCVAVEFGQPNFQLIELVKRDLKNWEMESDAAGLVNSWTENPMRTFW